jgi:poly-gamma-glutamate synthesis protein (capsule biosynthesis protein)
VGRRISEEGAEWVFSEVKHLLEKADLVIGNLECPITDDQNLTSSNAKVPLRASQESIKALKSGNFSIMPVGNNHILDFGEEGLSNTLNVLKINQIHHVGAGKNISEARRPLKLAIKGLRLGFLSYSSSYNATGATAGTVPLDPRSIKKDISKLKKDSDIIIVSLHHGVEYADYPTPGFMKLARELIDSGARVVLGHHPHFLQGIREYKSGIIAIAWAISFSILLMKNYGNQLIKGVF